jgi:hypothetical protein
MSTEPDHTKKPVDADTEAILARRRFLIQSTLAGLGIATAAAVTGCDDPRPCLTPPEPKPCLSEDTEKLKPEPDKPKVCLSEAPPDPKPCLSPPEPKPCLSEVFEEPKPCLSPPAPPPEKKELKPQVCLSMEIAPPEKADP